MRRARRRGRAKEAAIIVAVLVAAALVVVLASPRHRAFYLGAAGRAEERAVSAGHSLRSIPLSRMSPVTSAAATPAERGKRPLVADAQGRLRVPLADEVPPRLPAEGVPPGWELWQFSGHGEVELVRSEAGVALRMRTEGGSFALYRSVVIDLAEFPRLTWAWKAVRLPAGGDVRERRTDDEAAQLYVVFPRWPSPRTQSEVIGYVWDTTAPVGTRLTSPKAENVRIIVVASGHAELGTWQRFERNVAADYQALFGQAPPRVGTLALMTDANDTGSAAEVLVGDLAFAKNRP
ncbi:MAG: DUF3047 domain-containing protein [Candidatus Rokubacteria bacterium]|nr:DUF3047 domain-containing protein [Candidatus Rokubacteria bacterium]MBI3827719.1 DUF3047 domain-containing protein [Candidatus Rokubacteria bacterium]